MPDPVLSWSRVGGSAILQSDRGGFTLHRSSNRWRVFRHGKQVSLALSSKAAAIATAEELFADEPAGEIVLTNPPEGEKRPDPPSSSATISQASGTSTTPAPPAPTTKPVQVPPFLLIGSRRPIQADGTPLRSWL